MTATASAPIHPGSSPLAAWYSAAVDREGVDRGDAAGVSAARSISLDVSRPMLRWRWSTVLMDAVDLLAVVLSVPLAVLLVGAPIALTIALLIWLGRLALNAF